MQRIPPRDGEGGPREARWAGMRDDDAPQGANHVVQAHRPMEEERLTLALPFVKDDPPYSSPRFARLRISAPVPKVQGSASAQCTTTFESRPSRGEATV